ncbi:choline transporter, partial [Escherichia coli]|nr:choline transporter [Escherichia coli]
FFYEFLPCYYIQPAFALAGMGTESDDEKSEEQRYYRAEIHLKEGRQDYGWAKEQIIHDILDQYEKHIHFLHLLGK